MSNELERSNRIVFDKSFEDDINPDNIKLLTKYNMDMEVRGLSPKSIYNYKRDIIQWLSYLNREQFNLNIKEVTENDIEEFIYFCKQQGNNAERLKRRLSSVSAFYKFLRKKKEIKDNPCEFISRPKKGLPVVIQTFLTQAQYDKMKDKLSKQDNLQLYVYAMLAVDTMGRVNALANITWKQIDFENMAIDDVLEKEGKIVILYFCDDVKQLLLQLQKYREENEIDDKGYLFVVRDGNGYSNTTANTLHSWANKIGEMIGVPSLHPHDFRHTGSQLRKLKGMKIEDISALLNHSGLDVTRKFYLRQDKQEMREKMDKYKL